MLERSRAISAKPYREMTSQEKADYRAANNAEAVAWAKKILEKGDQITLDAIFAGKRTMTRATTERRLREKRRYD